MRVWGLAVLAAMVLATTVSGQTSDWRFRWQANEVLTYRVAHQTTVAETLNGSKVQTTSKLNLVKRWQVLSVDAQGTATMRLTLVSMRTEQVRPDGEVLFFDSANPDKSDPEMKKEMLKFIGQPLAELRVDATGRVLEVKQGSIEKYEVELPFGVVLPPRAVAVGQTWRRSFSLTLAPPLGTGEKYDGVQTFSCKSVDARQATITLTTAFKNLPQSSAEQIPLFQKQPEGEVIFDVSSGRYLGARLSIIRDLENHQGPGSRFHFESSYREELVSGSGG